MQYNDISYLLYHIYSIGINEVIFLQTEEWSNEPRKLHTRHPTEQTTTDEKLEKYFRHRYVLSLNLFCFYFLNDNEKFYIIK